MGKHDPTQLVIPDVAGLSPLEAALAYADAGLYVVPVANGSKNPGSIVGKDWPQQSTRDPDQLRRRWTDNPDAGIAWHVGKSAAVVFDLDRDSADELPVDVWLALQSGKIQRTRKGASVRGHYVFKCSPDEFTNASGGFMRYGQVRCRNGVIILEPSDHAKAIEGGLYRWVSTGAVPEIPKLLRDLLTISLPGNECADPKSLEELAAFLAAHTAEDRPHALKGQLSVFGAEVGAGASRHESMCKAVVWAFREAIVECYSAQRAYDELRAAFHVAKPESATSGEFDRMACWAAAQAEQADQAITLERLNRPTANVDERIRQEVEKLRIRESAREIYADAKAREKLMTHSERAVDGLGFLTTDAGIEPLWGRNSEVLWAAGEGLMICGPQGVGKSTIAQQLVLARLGLTEPELFGFPVTVDDRPVLYLAMDRPPQIRRSLARMVDLTDETTRLTLKRQLVMWSGPLPFDAAQAPDVFAEWVAIHGANPGLVVVDSLKDLATGLSKDEVGAGINAAMQRVLANGTEFVVLHHQRKATTENPKPDKLADVYGNSWITAGLGSVLLLWGAAGGATVELSHLKQPQDKVAPLIVNHTHRAGRSAASDPAHRLIELANNAGDEGITLAQAVQELFGVRVGDDSWWSAKGKTMRKLQKLTDDKVLKYSKGRPGGSGGGGIPAKWTCPPAERSTP